MQQSSPLFTPTIIANGVVAQQRFVDFTGAQVTTQGAKAIGVAKYGDPVGGNPIPIEAMGTTLVTSGAALTAGQAVISDNQGRAIPNTGALKIATGAVAVTSVAANGATDLAGSDPPEYIMGDVMPGQSATGAGFAVEIFLRR